MTKHSLLIRYRPTCFEEIVGHENIVRSLFNALTKRSSHSFLFIGPAGTGKTTMARLAATQLGCKPIDLMEIDAATNTGIDAMREVAADLYYQPLGEGSIKAVIVDECQNLSKAAFTSLLKIVEHPPEHVFWFFCTTDGAKVPAAIKTRCLTYELKPVPTAQLTEFLNEIANEEKLKLAEGIIPLCAKEAKGSPRQALANLALCASAKNKAEAAELLTSAEESEAAIDLARALYRGAGFKELVKIVSGLKTENPESVRHIVRSYGTTIILNKGYDSGALAVLEAFSIPFNSSDGVTPLLLACGRLTQS